MDNGERGVLEENAKDVNFNSPKSCHQYPYLQDRVNTVQSDIENETGEKFSQFNAVSFIKRNYRYIIRVNCGRGDNQYIDIKMNKELLQDFDTGKSLGDPMSF